MNEPPRVAIEPEEIVSFLKLKIGYKEVRQAILSQRLIEQAAKERGLTVTSEEIQSEAERQRREKRLEKASDTLAWLADELIAAEDWEAGIRSQILEKKLAEGLFAKDVEKFYAQNQFDFEQVLLYQIIIPYERVAQELFYQIEEEEISFYEAAHLYDVDEKRRSQCGYEGKVHRWSLKPDIVAVIFSAEPGQVIGPLQTEQGYHLLLVEEFIPAQLTPVVYQDILNRMFKEWLTQELNYMIHNQKD